VIGMKMADGYELIIKSEYLWYTILKIWRLKGKMTISLLDKITSSPISIAKGTT
jgi:hypothetical protein